MPARPAARLDPPVAARWRRIGRLAVAAEVLESLDFSVAAAIADAVLIKPHARSGVWENAALTIVRHHQMIFRHFSRWRFRDQMYRQR